MKLKNIFMLVTMAISIWGFAGCNDKATTDEYVFPANITLDQGSIELDPAATGDVTIENGNGSYKLETTDAAVATAELEGQTVRVTGHESGKASIIISDAKGVQSLINVLVYSDVSMEADAVTVKSADTESGLEFSGNKMEITSGNGGYQVECADPALDFRIQDDMVYITATAEVTDVPATLKDRTGRTYGFTVTATDPYKDFKAGTQLSVKFKSLSKVEGSGVTFVNTWDTNAKLFTYGWGTSTYSRVNVQFTGDLKPGKKANGVIRYGVSYSDYQSSYKTLKSLNVLKNEGGKVWIVFTYNDGTSDFDGTMLMNVVATN